MIVRKEKVDFLLIPVSEVMQREIPEPEIIPVGYGPKKLERNHVFKFCCRRFNPGIIEEIQLFLFSYGPGYLSAPWRYSENHKKVLKNLNPAPDAVK